jgi:hypothetical protein
MIVRNDIAVLVEYNTRPNAFTDLNGTIENIAIIYLRRNTYNSGTYFFYGLHNSRIAGVGQGFRLTVCSLNLYGNRIGTFQAVV